MSPSDVYKFSVLNAIIFLQIFFKQINVSLARTRISGGFTDNNYNLDLAKYVVSIRYSSAAEVYYFGAGHHCGGSILTTNFILTAAHCLDGRSEQYYHVVIGTPRRLDRTFNTQVINVKKFITHEYYNKSYGAANDIGLVELQNPIFIDYRTTDIIGITDEPLPINGFYFAAGWGTMYESGPSPNDILYATMYLVLWYSQCSYDLYMTYGPWHPMLFCAGNPKDPEMQAYMGDSGGPLFCNSRVVGIVSYGLPNIIGESLFTNVSNYIPWIRQYVWFDLKPYGETSARKNIYETKRRTERKSCGIVKNDKKSKIFHISFLILYMTLSHLSGINWKF